MPPAARWAWLTRPRRREVAGDHDADPDHGRSMTSATPMPRSIVRVHRVREQALPVDRGVDGRGRGSRWRTGRDDHAADDATGRDQADTGDGGAGDGEQHRAPEVVLGGSSDAAGRCRWRVGQVPVPLVRRWDLVRHVHLLPAGGRCRRKPRCHFTCEGGSSAISLRRCRTGRRTGGRLALPPAPGGSVRLAQRSAPAGRALEVSPSPVYGARLLSGFGS